MRGACGGGGGVGAGREGRCATGSTFLLPFLVPASDSLYGRMRIFCPGDLGHSSRSVSEHSDVESNT